MTVMEIASSIEFENKQGRISFELLITPCVAQHNSFDKSTTSTYKENAAEVSHTDWFGESGNCRPLVRNVAGWFRSFRYCRLVWEERTFHSRMR